MKRRVKYSSAILASLIFSLAPTLALLVTGVGKDAAVAQTASNQSRKAEADRLLQEGIQQLRQGKFRAALETFQKVLVIRKEVGDKAGEGTTLNNIGLVYSNLGQYPKALEFYQQALAISKEVGDKAREGATLNNIGGVYSNLGQYPKALEFYQQALAISKEVGDKAGEGTTLNNIGGVYSNLGQYPKALEFYQQALAISKEVGDKATEGTTLNNIGLVYHQQGQYPKALEFYQQALAIRKQVGDKATEGTTLNNIGLVYHQQGQYPKALEFYQQALAIAKQIGDSSGEGVTLTGIGLVYYNLGQYPKALEFYQQALTIRKEVGDKAGEGTTLNNIGGVYDSLGQYPKALEFYQQALAIRKEVGDKAGEGTTLNNIGSVYDKLGQYPKALEFYQQALAIHKEVGNKPMEGTTLNNIGAVYDKLGQYPKALEFYQQALAILKEIGDSSGEGGTLNNIGYLLNAQKQPELAIVFFKQSVSTYETIRQQLRVLPKEQQQSYTETIAGTYRTLADLLLKQNRILEAQQVLDLLKIQEIEDYLRNVRGTGQKLYELPPEREILAKYNELQQSTIALGKELTQLRKIPEPSRTPQQQQRIAQLVKLQEDLNEQFNAFTSRADVVALVKQLSPQIIRQTVDLSQLDSLRDDLRGLDAVILYPLVLEDRLELVITTPNSPPLRRTVNVKREDLNRTIAEFRQVLQNPGKDAKPIAQQLYTWLIKPLENDLKLAGVKTIIYSPDAQLRYIPLAALHDGNQWLVQRYKINNITAKSLTDFTSKPQPQPRVLAGAFVQGTYNVKLGDDTLTFSGLTYAGKEVENLVSLIPNSTKLFDKQFSRDATTSKMNEYNIVHMATHAAFVPGAATDSFILFGNGDTATLKDIEKWSLNNVDLVVLSACETGLGGKFGENGEEVLGLGYQFQNRGVRATIASLWQVDDGGTQALMDAFYAFLENGNSTKAEALRQAQTALITGDFQALGEKRGIAVRERIRNGVPVKVQSRLSHPYYWAPFILIGNGL
jgi:CHAT domain-containing protein/Tfp pilus assembly protein PilF